MLLLKWCAKKRFFGSFLIFCSEKKKSDARANALFRLLHQKQHYTKQRHDCFCMFWTQCWLDLKVSCGTKLRLGRGVKGMDHRGTSSKKNAQWDVTINRFSREEFRRRSCCSDQALCLVCILMTPIFWIWAVGPFDPGGHLFKAGHWAASSTKNGRFWLNFFLRFWPVSGHQI